MSFSPPPANASPEPAYAVPALEKGLDIIELLVDRADGLTQAEVAAELDRSHSEIFRMLNCLVQRGYIQREGSRAAYRLTRKLFELAHRHRKIEPLITSALPRMQSLAKAVRNDCHLAVIHGTRGLTVAQAESDEPWRFSVRVGTTLTLTRTASGRVLLAFRPANETDSLYKAARAECATDAAWKKVRQRLQQVREQGYEHVTGETFDGIVDISAPVFAFDGTVAAALTMPVLMTMLRQSEIQKLIPQVRAAADEISAAMGYIRSAPGKST